MFYFWIPTLLQCLVWSWFCHFLLSTWFLQDSGAVTKRFICRFTASAQCHTVSNLVEFVLRTISGTSPLIQSGHHIQYLDHRLTLLPALFLAQWVDWFLYPQRQGGLRGSCMRFLYSSLWFGHRLSGLFDLICLRFCDRNVQMRKEFRRLWELILGLLYVLLSPQKSRYCCWFRCR